ncbi:MAG: V-type ATP synthase subunit D, partial [Anaerolineae bacterium]|nr:V-type ATP synthase subunit D [Anaerolineae bacterium]
MPVQQIAPTRSNLMQTRQTLKMAREGHDILEQKRDVLTAELTRRAHDAVAKQKEVWAEISQAYRALAEARLSMGQERLEWTALAVNKSLDLDIQLYSVMGVVLPRISAHGHPPDMPYGPGDTTVALDEAVVRFRKILSEIPELVEMMTTVRHLAHELQKTQRRVNALEHIFIPKLTNTERYITMQLQEREREDFFRRK